MTPQQLEAAEYAGSFGDYYDSETKDAIYKAYLAGSNSHPAKLTKAIEALEDCVNSLEYAAFHYDGLKINDLPDGIIESTSPSKTALISARNAKQTLTELKQQP